MPKNSGTRVFTRRSSLAASAGEVFLWHVRPGAFERLTPPWEKTVVVSRTGGVENGARVTLRVPTGPTSTLWVAEHRDVEPGRGFRDVQLQGPFASWDHRHRMEPAGASSVLEDHIEYALPAGAAGDLVAGRFVRRTLDAMFDYRHAVIAADLADHAACRQGAPMKIAITGATGLVGSALTSYLTTGGHAVVPVPRDAPPAQLRGVLEGIDAVVHLAGESIAEGRWTEARKRRIRESRLEGTTALATAVAALERKPRVLVSASAIGFYGDRGDERLTEASAPGTGFLAEVCQAWEAATRPAAAAGVRVANLRFGLILSPKGGALGAMLTPFKMGVGGTIGPGTQWMSWIALDDVLGVIHHVLDKDGLDGAVNTASPQPVTNASFTKTLGRVLHRPTLAPLPAFAARLALGEMADALLLSSARVVPRRLEASGYRFRHPDLEGALRVLLGRKAA